MPSTYKPTGYHRLAQLMGCSSDIAIFRRFSDLNMLCLMSLQAELMDLREEFCSICEDDEKEAAGFSQSFSHLRESKDSPNNFQYHKLEQIKSKLKEYSMRFITSDKLLYHKKADRALRRRSTNTK